MFFQSETGKSKAIIMLVTIIIVVCIALLVFFTFKNRYSNNEANKEVIVQVKRIDNSNNEEATIIETKADTNKHSEIKLKDNNKIELYGEEANDIRIIDIKDSSVSISRTKIIIEDNGETSKEEIKDIKYGERIPISINEDKRSTPVPTSQPRYDYYVVISKK